MKKAAVLAVALFALCLCLPQTGFADESAAATAGVFIDVNPNIGVLPIQANVDAGTVQTGDFKATVVFRIDANTQKVRFYATATDLYKGDDPVNVVVPPIQLNTAAGVQFAIEFGNPVQGGTGNAKYTGPGERIGSYPSLQTEAIVFESSQNGHCSQNAFVTVGWTQPDPEKPMGEYSGKVKLTAMIVLPIAS